MVSNLDIMFKDNQCLIVTMLSNNLVSYDIILSLNININYYIPLALYNVDHLIASDVSHLQ